jgi:hypothetical protein
MKTLRIITALAIAGNVGFAIIDYDLHSVVGWLVALCYFACFELNESQIRKMRDEK